MNGVAMENATRLQHALLIAALADGRSQFFRCKTDSVTQSLINSLLALGVAAIADPVAERIDVAGTGGYWPNSDAELDAGNSFPLACLLTAACSIGRGQYTVSYDTGNLGDAPLVPLLSALVDLRASVVHDVADDGRMVINVGPGAIRGGTIRLPMGCPPAVLESLLIVAPYATDDVMIEARNATHSAIEHLIPLMETFNVSVLEDAGRFIIAAPQRYRGRELDGWE
ncbi:MAG TPA: hypothetical protein PLL65_12995 [Phycisphaerae bacterium]|nr:hypothetical protein [Phycisphaerae bacterium]